MSQSTTHNQTKTLPIRVYSVGPAPKGKSAIIIVSPEGASVDDSMAFREAMETSGAKPVILGIALAIVLHKPFDGLTVAALMVADGTRRRLQWFVALAFCFGLRPVEHSAVVGAGLVFCAGTFLSIAGADLLPELQFHRHDRLKLSMALLLGVAVAVAVVLGGHPVEH